MEFRGKKEQNTEKILSLDAVQKDETKSGEKKREIKSGCGKNIEKYHKNEEQLA